MDIIVPKVFEELLEKRIPFFQKLVQTPSTRGVEGHAQLLMHEEFEKCGLHTEIVSIMRGGEVEPLSRRPVVVGRLKGSGGGRSIILNCHMDTAPAGPLELWDKNPFSGEIRDGYIHGRGSWDDKAGCVSILLLLDMLNHMHLRLKGDLIVESVIEDEYSGNGTRACITDSLKADAAVIVDGHYNSRFATGHPGHLEFAITLHGQPAPSCRASAGQNAIEKACYLASGIQKWSDRLHRMFEPGWEQACEGTLLNIGTIEGGGWIGTVPAKCTFEGLLRFAPPVNLDLMKSLLEQQITELCNEDPWLKQSPPTVAYGELQIEPVLLGRDNLFFRLLEEQISTVMHIPPEPYLCPGWCDLYYFHRFFQIPCCLFGPGKGDGAHRPNERFYIQDLIPHTQVLLQLVMKWCGVEH